MRQFECWAKLKGKHLEIFGDFSGFGLPFQPVGLHPSRKTVT
jgi:hypothetical protein